MNDQELLRYSRHILLDEISIEGQERISSSHALVIGAGGLGSACLPYLVAAGIGQITIVDHDLVDLTNLQRQIIHQQDSVGLLKVDSAKEMLSKLNSLVTIHTRPQKADEALLNALLPKVDIAIDCTDNFLTRHLINRLAIFHKKPLIFGAAIRFDGQISVFDNNRPDSPCYACIFPEEEQFEEIKCSTMGVFSPLVGIIGAMQAAQTLQVLGQFGQPLIGHLGIWSGLTNELNLIKLKKKKSCSVCSVL